VRTIVTAANVKRGHNGCIGGGAAAGNGEGDDRCPIQRLERKKETISEEEGDDNR
jgi:hypothetical protein